MSSLAWAASSRADGEPSNGHVTSTRMADVSSCDIMVRSGLLSPVVPGGGLLPEDFAKVGRDCSDNAVNDGVVRFLLDLSQEAEKR